MKVLLIILAVFLYGVNADAKGTGNDCCNNDLSYAECVELCGTSECCESKAAGEKSSGCCDANLSKEECANKCGTSECCESKAVQSGTQSVDCCDDNLSKEECANKCGTSECCESKAVQSGTQSTDCCDVNLSKEECANKCGTSECCDNGKAGGDADDKLKCIVAGEVIEGEAVTYTYLGKEYSFCCAGCVSAFKNEPIKFIDGLKCPVMGGDAKVNVTSQIDGVNYYFCCPPCIEEFTNNFEKYNAPQTETLKSEDATDHKH